MDKCAFIFNWIYINAFESMIYVISKQYQVVNQLNKVDNIVINKYHGLISTGPR